MHRTFNAAVAIALLLTLGCMAMEPIVLQAERATLTNVTPATTRAAHEGDAYVTGFTAPSSALLFNVEAPAAGVYDLDIRYAAAGGKGYALTVNDVGYDGFFPASPDAWSTFAAGKIELAAGANAIKLGKGWGHFDIDSLRLTPSRPYEKPKAIAPTLSTANASDEAQDLMKRLVGTYGTTTLSGLISPDDVRYLREVTGASPAVMAGDLMDYTPSRRERGAEPKGETERLIAAHRNGQIVTVSWHWNAPRDLIDKREHVDAKGNKVDASWYRGFYSNATTFDFAAALDQPEGEAYQLLIRDIDVIAAELRKLHEAKVPVLWRPLHESDGTWFWWGTRGPANLNRLWRLLHERLTVHHKLDNLIWVYTWNDHDWYPGDDVVDIVGIDAYPSKVNDRLSAKWAEALRTFDGKKLIALSEFGGVPDVEGMHRLGIAWSYFASWSGEQGPRKNAREDLVRIFKSPTIANLQK